MFKNIEIAIKNDEIFESKRIPLKICKYDSEKLINFKLINSKNRAPFSYLPKPHAFCLGRAKDTPDGMSASLSRRNNLGIRREVL